MWLRVMACPAAVRGLGTGAHPGGCGVIGAGCRGVGIAARARVTACSSVVIAVVALAGAMGFLICRMGLLERTGVRLGDGAGRIRGPRDHIDLRRLFFTIDELGNHARIERSSQRASIGGVV